MKIEHLIQIDKFLSDNSYIIFIRSKLKTIPIQINIYRTVHMPSSNHCCQHKHHKSKTMRKQLSISSLRPYPNQSPITVNQFQIADKQQYQKTTKSTQLLLSSKKVQRELRRVERQQQYKKLQRQQQNKRVGKSRQRQRQILSISNNNNYGKIMNLTIMRRNATHHQYPYEQQQTKYITNSTQHNIIHEQQQQLQPQIELQNQLQKQISQLHPMKKSFTNLQHYYQQLVAQYNLLLAQTNVLSKLTSSSSAQLSSSPLRQLQLQYQQQSDYLNMHLIPKLTTIKQQNLVYCQHYNSLEIQLTQHNQLIHNTMLETNILSSQHNKINQQLRIQKQQHQLVSNKIHLLSQSIKEKLSVQKILQQKLFKIKQKKEIEYQREIQLISTINENKIKNSKLIAQYNKLKENGVLAEELYHQRRKRVEHLQNHQLKSLGLKNHQLQQQLHQSNQQTHQLEIKLNSTKQLLQNTQSALQYVTTQQLPIQQQQHDKLQQQLVKNTNFLSYLKQYQQQLKSTSNLMFQQLNTSCQEDYDKLLKNKLKFLTNNIEANSKKSDHLSPPPRTGNSKEIAVQNDNKYVINIHYDDKKDYSDEPKNSNVKLLSFSQTQQASQQPPPKTPKQSQQQLKNPPQKTQSKPPHQLTQSPPQQSDGNLSQLYFTDQSSTRNNSNYPQPHNQPHRLSSQPQRQNSPPTHTLSNFSFNLESVQRLIQQRTQQLKETPLNATSK